jgi:hypothetical protein
MSARKRPPRESPLPFDEVARRLLATPPVPKKRKPLAHNGRTKRPKR